MATGVNEPHAGYDVTAIKNARKEGDDDVINGIKIWITTST
jgi:alkylation response protein AidB-like acyl-CoA dehydrogenase